ncbi:MAG: hydrolase, partial [Flavobacteriaceae bacterium]|nr:hydrolase [Flavobacteriaceae bacterium]
TNVIRNGDEFRDANTTGLVFDVADKGNNFGASGRAIVSNVNTSEGMVTGLLTELDIAKIRGNWQYRVGHDFANTTYDINDLGVNFRNNFNNFVAGVSYQIFEPTEWFNNYRISLTARHRRLYQPSVTTGNTVNMNWFFATKSRLAFGGNLGYNSEDKDYFEPRVEGRFVRFPSSLGGNIWISTDYRKKFAFDATLGHRQSFGEEQPRYNFRFSPRYRFSDKLLVVLSSNGSVRHNQFGYIDQSETEIFFGQRDIRVLENEITASYNFDPFKAIDLRFRNFWTVADYSDDVFYVLNEDGTRTITSYDVEANDPNRNFDIWNLDLSFRWRFAPGSEATLLYRNQIFKQDNQATLSYTESLGNLFEQPIQNTLSLRITYFLDYNNLTAFLKKNS